MSDTTSDNDDLSLTYEHIIAGVVILLFGLLYWFLNNGFSTTPSIPALAPVTTKVETKIPRQGYPLSPALAGSTAAVTAANIKSPSDTSLSASTSVEMPEKNALQADAMTQKKDEQPQATEAEVIEPVAETTESTEPEENTSNQLEMTSETSSEEIPEADVIANNTNKTDLLATSKPEVSETSHTDPSNSDTKEIIPTYSLPNGEKIQISANGFEGDLQQLFQNGVLNKSLTFDQVYFDTGSTKINAKSNRQIKVTAALMNAFPETNILIRGHTDNRGSATDNFQLSLARANSMGLALGALGIDTERIRVLGMGDGFPIASNNTEAGRKKNRRIEILLQ